MAGATKRRTWVLLADASRAKLFEMRGLEKPVLFRELEHRESREQGRDLIGNRPNASQHHLEGDTRARWSPGSLRTVESERFARELTALLEKARAENAFDELVVSAPPHLLGELRGQFSKALMEQVVKTDARRWVDARPEELLSGLLGP